MIIVMICIMGGWDGRVKACEGEESSERSDRVKEEAEVRCREVR